VTKNKQKIKKMNYLLVFIGGGLGSVLRFIIALFVSKTSLSLPIATLSSNVLSCFIFGTIIYMYQGKNLIPENYKHLVLIGICGGLSTFSTFSYETFEMLKQGMMGWAILNIAISCVLCTGIFFMLAK
jgi:CrcB protein